MPCIGKNAEQLELSYLAGEHVNSFNPFKSYLVKNVVSSVIHNNSKLETIHMSITRRVEKL